MRYLGEPEPCKHSGLPQPPSQGKVCKSEMDFEFCRITKSLEKGKCLGVYAVFLLFSANSYFWSMNLYSHLIWWVTRIFAQFCVWRLKTFRVLLYDSIFPLHLWPIPGVIPTSYSITVQLTFILFICPACPGFSRLQIHIAKEVISMKIKYWYQKHGHFVIPVVIDPNCWKLAGEVRHWPSKNSFDVEHHCDQD